MKKTPEPREEDKIPPPVATEPENNFAETETADDLVASLQSDLDRFRDLALRTQADFENYKKRGAREKDEAIKYANRTLLERLVPIVDNFELGLSAARDQKRTLADLFGNEHDLETTYRFPNGKWTGAGRCGGKTV